MYKIQKQNQNQNQNQNQKQIQNQKQKNNINIKNIQNYNNYCGNDNNDLQYLQNKSLVDDISKMHLLPPHCPMKPNSYKDFFNDSSELYGVSPYHLNVRTHKKDGKPKLQLQYNNFYSNFKTDSLKYNTPVMNELDSIESDNTNPLINNSIKDKNIKLYEETKNKKTFAIPMKSNGNNSLEYLYNDCVNKPTFLYKTFGAHNLKDKIDNTHKYNNWVDNPIYNIDITEETNILYTDFMNSRENNASNIYNSVFEDMYILGYNPSVE